MRVSPSFSTTRTRLNSTWSPISASRKSNRTTSPSLTIYWREPSSMIAYMYENPLGAALVSLIFHNRDRRLPWPRQILLRPRLRFQAIVDWQPVRYGPTYPQDGLHGNRLPRQLDRP